MTVPGSPAARHAGPCGNSDTIEGITSSRVPGHQPVACSLLHVPTIGALRYLMNFTLRRHGIVPTAKLMSVAGAAILWYCSPVAFATACHSQDW